MEQVKPVELGGLGYPQLKAMIDEAKGNMAAEKAWLDKLNAELEARLGNEARRSLDAQGKDHGTVNMPLQGGITAKVVIDRKIEWDSDKLLDLAVTMPMDRAKQIFKFALSVPEKNYAGITALGGELADGITAARTTKPGAPKITLTAEG